MEGSRTLCRGRGVEEEEVVSPEEGRHGRGHPLAPATEVVGSAACG
jgi:hypothetical protein